ncbi:hypothetical protein K3165_07035 [Qipengyuania sp. 1XM1-15A]|uniref:hypothetical protein n=1 Tax=Qipengyuania xiamenensis TaxID=2867237 RepID=UPI001C8678C0|nr:hypothetical protein [Qipengyuania xiamenensis]MBX7532671.1 hypothetical protein [Qipengyuania xiamenensis]
MIDDGAIQLALADDRFGSNAWLTFYLFGDPEALRAMKPGLIAMDAVNLDGEEAGCFYAKVPVQLERTELERTIANVRALSSEHDVRIDIVDLDSSADVSSSKFFTLWTAP